MEPGMHVRIALFALVRRIVVQPALVRHGLAVVQDRSFRPHGPAEAEEVVALDRLVPDVVIGLAPDALHLLFDVVRSKAYLLVDGRIIRMRDVLRPVVAFGDIVVAGADHVHGTWIGAVHLVPRLLVELHLAHHAIVRDVAAVQYRVDALLLEELHHLNQRLVVEEDIVARVESFAVVMAAHVRVAHHAKYEVRFLLGIPVRRNRKDGQTLRRQNPQRGQSAL